MELVELTRAPGSVKIAAAPGNTSPFHGLPWRAPGGLPSVVEVELVELTSSVLLVELVCKKCAVTLHLSGPALVELVNTEPRGPGPRC